MKTFLPILILFLFSCNNEEDAYFQFINQRRVFKNIQFSNPEKSPLPVDVIRAFTGLSYYPVDKNWKVEGVFHANPHLLNSSGFTASDTLILFGEIELTLQEIPIRLQVFKQNNTPDSVLFLPFYDLTNHSDTYSGGRFVEVILKGHQRFVVDFNLSYFPYCAYNEHYICPVPPFTNKINLEVLAGEKLPLIE